MTELDRLKKLVRNYESLFQAEPVPMSIVNEYVRLKHEIERLEKVELEKNVMSGMESENPLFRIINEAAKAKSDELKKQLQKEREVTDELMNTRYR